MNEAQLFVKLQLERDIKLNQNKQLLYTQLGFSFLFFAIFGRLVAKITNNSANLFTIGAGFLIVAFFIFFGLFIKRTKTDFESELVNIFKYLQINDFLPDKSIKDKIRYLRGQFLAYRTIINNPDMVTNTPNVDYKTDINIDLTFVQDLTLVDATDPSILFINSLLPGDTVLVASQIIPTENGLYTFDSSGSLERTPNFVNSDATKNVTYVKQKGVLYIQVDDGKRYGESLLYIPLLFKIPTFKTDFQYFGKNKEFEGDFSDRSLLQFFMKNLETINSDYDFLNKLIRIYSIFIIVSTVVCSGILYALNRNGKSYPYYMLAFNVMLVVSILLSALQIKYREYIF